MLKTHKFARKPFYVDAVRVSEANMEEVANWCEGSIESSDEGRFISVKVHRPITERQTQAFIGDWVLFAGSGFKVYTPKAFDKSFEKVKTLTKAQADEAGIKVPHEPRQPRKAIKFSPRKMGKTAAAEDAVRDQSPKPTPPPIAKGSITMPFEVFEEAIAKKSEADRLIQEVLAQKLPGDRA